MEEWVLQMKCKLDTILLFLTRRYLFSKKKQSFYQTKESFYKEKNESFIDVDYRKKEEKDI